MKTLLAGGLLAATLAALPAAHAQSFAPAKGEDAQRYRQSALFMMGQHVGALVPMVRGDRPYDAAAFQWHAQQIDTLAHLPWDSFWVAGADQGKHRMKPEIAREKDKFLALAHKLQEETARLATTARGGDLNAIKPAFQAVGAACKQCHDTYRAQ
jgi:cytochrome c556